MVLEYFDVCPFCPNNDKCNKPWCPHTEEEEGEEKEDVTNN